MPLIHFWCNFVNYNADTPTGDGETIYEYTNILPLTEIHFHFTLVGIIFVIINLVPYMFVLSC